MSEIQRHLLIAKVNIITESKKLTTFSDTFSYEDMKLKFPLSQEYLNQKKPIIFQIVYTSEVRTFIFNVYGTVSSDAPMIVVFTKESHNVIFQFLTDVITKKKIV